MELADDKIELHGERLGVDSVERLPEKRVEEDPS